MRQQNQSQGAGMPVAESISNPYSSIQTSIGGGQMKRAISILAMLVLMATLLPAAFAQQDQSAQPSSSAQQRPSAPAQGSSAQAPSQESNSFSGTVVKSGDKYVLQVGSMTYQLDDQDKAKQFEGKQVKVNGSLDKARSTIHITDIQPVPEK